MIVLGSISNLKCFHAQTSSSPAPTDSWICSRRSNLRSRRLEVVGERENGRARGRHACLLFARPFFLVSTTSKRGSPEFKSSTTFVNNQLVCPRSVGILNPVMQVYVNFLFELFVQITSLCAINTCTAEGKYRNNYFRRVKPQQLT